MKSKDFMEPGSPVQIWLAAPKKIRNHIVSDLFYVPDRFEHSDATVRWTVARDGSTERNNYLAKQDTNKSG